MYVIVTAPVVASFESAMSTGRCTSPGTEGACRHVKIRQDTSRFPMRTSRNVKGRQRENGPETPETALRNLDVWAKNLDVS